MRNKCMVLLCNNCHPTTKYQFFRLTAARHDAWLLALGRDPNIEHLSNGNRICSMHFADDDIIIKNNKAYLKPGAIPTKELGRNRGIWLQNCQRTNLGHLPGVELQNGHKVSSAHFSDLMLANRLLENRLINTAVPARSRSTVKPLNNDHPRGIKCWLINKGDRVNREK